MRLLLHLVRVHQGIGVRPRRLQGRLRLRALLSHRPATTPATAMHASLGSKRPQHVLWSSQTFANIMSMMWGALHWRRCRLHLINVCSRRLSLWTLLAIQTLCVVGLARSPGNVLKTFWIGAKLTLKMMDASVSLIRIGMRLLLRLIHRLHDACFPRSGTKRLLAIHNRIAASMGRAQ